MANLQRVLILRRTIQRAATIVTLPALVTCTDGPTATSSAQPERPRAEAAVTSGTASTQGTIPLPIHQDVTSTGIAFGIIQRGSGAGALFAIGGPSTNWRDALWVTTGGTGRAGYFDAANPASNNAAILASTNSSTGAAGEFETRNLSGFGSALRATAKSRGRAATLSTDNPANIFPTLSVSTNGLGTGGEFYLSNGSNARPAVHAVTYGGGTGLQVSHWNASCSSTPTACNLAVFRSGGTNQIRFGRLGRGFFNGGTQTGGADVAEAFAVEGRPSDYEPGDVLVISTRSDRRVERSQEPYSTLVAGVYATKPGVLLTERHIDTSLDDTVPLAVVGVVPTKVSTENGVIRRGDILVTGRTPGHAMRANPNRLRVGTSLGKALEVFAGPGTGVIRVLVNVK